MTQSKSSNRLLCEPFLDEVNEVGFALKVSQNADILCNRQTICASASFGTWRSQPLLADGFNYLLESHIANLYVAVSDLRNCHYSYSRLFCNDLVS